MRLLSILIAVAISMSAMAETENSPRMLSDNELKEIKSEFHLPKFGHVNSAYYVGGIERIYPDPITRGRTHVHTFIGGNQAFIGRVDNAVSVIGKGETYVVTAEDSTYKYFCVTQSEPLNRCYQITD